MNRNEITDKTANFRPEPVNILLTITNTIINTNNVGLILPVFKSAILTAAFILLAVLQW